MLPSKLSLLFALFLVAPSFADDELPCNDLLSGLSVELKLSIQNLAELRFDLDRQITMGANDVVSRTLTIEFDKKLIEILRASGLTQEELLSLLRNEVQKVQNRDQGVTAKKIEAQRKQAEELIHAETRIDMIGNLHEARIAHTQSLLPDGKVLIVGGYHSNGTLASIELIQVGRK